MRTLLASEPWSSVLAGRGPCSSPGLVTLTLGVAACDEAEDADPELDFIDVTMRANAIEADTVTPRVPGRAALRVVNRRDQP